jgi:ribosomal protein S18 acetylase RimI-like enzyme
MELGHLRLPAYVFHRLKQRILVTRELPTIWIRKATSQDVPGILECLRAAFEDYRHLYTPAAFLDTVLTSEIIQVRLAKMVVFVAVNSTSEISGTIACEVLKPGEGHLRGMAVLPAWRGTGLARQLLSRAESKLHSRNCARITLDTTEPLLRAMSFYEKLGYRRSGRVSDFFGMPLIEYEKTLPPGART